MRKTAMVIMVVLCVHAYAFGYDEPDRFAGLKFGEDLTKQMKECPHMALPSGVRIPDERKIQASKTRCYGGTDQEHGSYALFNMGDIEREVEEIWANQLNGKLAHVVLNFPRNKFEIVFSIFKQRYGNPTSQSRQPWEMRVRGACPPAVQPCQMLIVHAVWKGRNVSINMDERDKSGLFGTAEYVTDAWLTYLKQSESDKIKKESERTEEEAKRKIERVKRGANGL